MCVFYTHGQNTGSVIVFPALQKTLPQQPVTRTHETHFTARSSKYTLLHHLLATYTNMRSWPNIISAGIFWKFQTVTPPASHTNAHIYTAHSLSKYTHTHTLCLGRTLAVEPNISVAKCYHSHPSLWHTHTLSQSRPNTSHSPSQTLAAAPASLWWSVCGSNKP